MSQRQQNKTRSRHAILSAARELMADLGPAETSTRQIAKLAGISYQTLYNYYPSKADLIRAMLEEQFERLSAQIDQLIKRYEGDLVASCLSITDAGLQQITGPNGALWRELAKLTLQSKPDAIS